MATIKDRIESILSSIAEIQNHAGDERLGTFATELTSVDLTLSGIVDSLGECGIVYGTVRDIRTKDTYVSLTCHRNKNHDGEHDELGD